MFEIQQANLPHEDSILVELKQRKVKSFVASKENQGGEKHQDQAKRSRKVRK